MKSYSVIVAFVALLTAGVCPASAQEAVSPDKGRTRTVRDARIFEADAKIPILAKSSAAQISVTIPPAGDSSTPLEERLTALIKQLPHETRWMKLLPPPPPEKSRFRPDDVADLVVTQEKLFGPQGDSIAAKTQH